MELQHSKMQQAKLFEIGLLMLKQHIIFSVQLQAHIHIQCWSEIFHAVIGEETKQQCKQAFGRSPDVLLACVGGGSNAMGLFHSFVEDKSVRMIGVEAAGDGVETGRHAATITEGRIGVLHGAMSLLLQDKDGQVEEAHSISAGLDYPGVGPEHSYLKEIDVLNMQLLLTLKP